MANFSLSRSLLALFLVVIALFSRTSTWEAKSSFSFGKNASFESQDIALYGEAKLIDGGSSVQLNNSVSHGVGRVVYKEPIESADTKSDYFTGFDTVFSFSMSPGRGGRLGFVMFPANGTFDQSFFEVKFDISENFTKLRDSSVTVIANGTMVSEEMSNLTIANLEKENKDNFLLYAWINYQASGRYLDVHLSKSESYRSADYTLFFSRNGLLKGEDEFMVGIKSYSGNFNLHSWKLGARFFSRSIHSYVPLLLEKLDKEEEAKRKRRERMWETVTCFVMTFGSTGLIFFAMMHIWAALKRNSLVMVTPEERVLKAKEFRVREDGENRVVTSKAEAQQAKK